MTSPEAEPGPAAAVPVVPAPAASGSAAAPPAACVPSVRPVSPGGPVSPGEPVLPEQSREDTDAAWGEYPEPDDDRLYRDRPPHWADF